MNRCRRTKSLCLVAFGISALLAGTAFAESGPLLDAGGCFGGLPAPACETTSDCDGEAICYQGQCNCSIGACEGSSTRRETCTEDGCVCEDRPTCTSHNDCEAVLCLFGQCTAGQAECEANAYAFEVCDTPDNCRCELRPTCDYHSDCGDVLCQRGQCTNGDTECEENAFAYELCDDVGCQCATRERCSSHDECEGATLCVLGYCNDTVATCSASEEAPYEVCHPGGARCNCTSRNPDAGVPDSGPRPDAGIGSGDAGQSDAGPDGGTASGGGGCSTSGTGGSGWLLLVLGWAFRRKRVITREAQ